MNAGAMDSSIFDAVESVRLMDREGTVQVSPGASWGRFIATARP